MGDITELAELKSSHPQVDMDHFMTLYQTGKYSSYKLGELTGTSQATAWRIIQKIRTLTKEIETFIQDRPNALTAIHNKSLAIQERIYDHYHNMSEADFIDLSPDAKRALLHTAGINANNLHNQERLERGQSTENTVNLSLVGDVNSILNSLKQ